MCQSESQPIYHNAKEYLPTIRLLGIAGSGYVIACRMYCLSYVLEVKLTAARHVGLDLGVERSKATEVLGLNMACPHISRPKEFKQDRSNKWLMLGYAGKNKQVKSRRYRPILMPMLDCHRVLPVRPTLAASSQEVLDTQTM